MLFLLLALGCGESDEETPDATPLDATTELDETTVPDQEEPKGPKVPEDSVKLVGVVDGFGDGQVRCVEIDGAAKVVHVAPVIQGHFSIKAPRGRATPFYIAVTGEDGSWAALPEPITLGDEELSVSFSSTDQPEWAASMEPAPTTIIDPTAELAVLDQEVPGPHVLLRGTVEAPTEGQVRFLEELGGELRPVCIVSLKSGAFSAQVPLNNANPVYIAASSSEGRWTALDAPVTVLDQDIEVTLTAENHPAWAEGLGLDRLIVYEHELAREASGQ